MAISGNNYSYNCILSQMYPFTTACRAPLPRPFPDAPATSCSRRGACRYLRAGADPLRPALRPSPIDAIASFAWRWTRPSRSRSASRRNAGNRARVANLGERGGYPHPHHELAIVGERSQPIEDFDAPVLLERRKSRERADRGHPGARPLTVAEYGRARQ